MDEILSSTKESDFPIATKYYSFSKICRDKFDGPGDIIYYYYYIWRCNSGVCSENVLSLLYPVVFLAQGKADLKGILQATTKKEFLRYFAWKLEGLCQELYLANQPNSPYKKTGNQGTLLLGRFALFLNACVSRDQNWHIFKTSRDQIWRDFRWRLWLVNQVTLR